MASLIFRKAERVLLVQHYDRAFSAKGIVSWWDHPSSGDSEHSGNYRFGSSVGMVSCALDVSPRLAHFFVRFAEPLRAAPFIAVRSRFYGGPLNPHSGKWNDHATPHAGPDRLFSALYLLESFLDTLDDLAPVALPSKQAAE